MSSSRLRASLEKEAKEALARLPFLFAKELVYDDRYFADMDPAHEQMYGRLADVLYELFEPSSVVDVGCGTGRLLAGLAAHGVTVRGIEGSRHAIARSPVAVKIERSNLENGVPRLGRFDLSLCIEVAEHLPRRSAGRLVRGLTRLSDLMIFTAAQPGQGGLLHRNEQPGTYWRALFEENGFRASDVLTTSVRERIADIADPVWMHANLVVYEQGGGLQRP